MLPMRNSLFFLCLVAAAALLLAAPDARAGNVTTNDYNASSTSSNIDKSCKNLDFDTSNGNVTGTCNGGTVSTSLDLDNYARCNGGTLEWGSGVGQGLVGVDNYLSAGDIQVSSNGKQYLLTGTCSSTTGATDTAEDTLRIGDKVVNSKGGFAYSASGR